MTKMTLKTDGETQVIVARRFAAPPERVFDAHTKAELLQKWCLGPEGWTMPVCICDPVPGGKMRCEWSDGENGFHLTAEFIELERPHRILHVERMHLPDPTPDNRVETLFKPDGNGGTLMVMTMDLPSAEAREMMLATGMEEGMEASYARLEGML
jgi:uncharacterized protein YndB with AHSA1/START domain